jgi:hypothetical protein
LSHHPPFNCNLCDARLCHFSLNFDLSHHPPFSYLVPYLIWSITPKVKRLSSLVYVQIRVHFKGKHSSVERMGSWLDVAPATQALFLL